MKIFNRSMKIFHIVLVFSCLFLSNCDDKNTEKQDDALNDNEAESQIVTEKDIERFRYRDYALSTDAKEATIDWAKFQELATQISFLKKADVTFFTSETDTLKIFLNTLKKNIPQVLKTNSIDARIVVLETKLLKFNSELTLDNYSKKDKLESIKALLIANSDLIYLINKKLEIDKNDIERPLFNQKSDTLEVDILEGIEIIE